MLAHVMAAVVHELGEVFIEVAPVYLGFSLFLALSRSHLYPRHPLMVRDVVLGRFKV